MSWLALPQSFLHRLWSLVSWGNTMQLPSLPQDKRQHDRGVSCTFQTPCHRFLCAIGMDRLEGLLPLSPCKWNLVRERSNYLLSTGQGEVSLVNRSIHYVSLGHHRLPCWKKPSRCYHSCPRPIETLEWIGTRNISNNYICNWKVIAVPKPILWARWTEICPCCFCLGDIYTAGMGPCNTGAGLPLLKTFLVSQEHPCSYHLGLTFKW